MEDSTQNTDSIKKKIFQDISKKKSNNKNIISFHYNKKPLKNINKNKILYQNKSWRNNSKQNLEKPTSNNKSFINNDENTKIPNNTSDKYRKEKIKKCILKTSRDDLGFNKKKKRPKLILILMKI